MSIQKGTGSGTSNNGQAEQGCLSAQDGYAAGLSAQDGYAAESHTDLSLDHSPRGSGRTGVEDIQGRGRSSLLSWFTFGRHVRACLVFGVHWPEKKKPRGASNYPVPRLVPGPRNFRTK